MFLIPYRVEVFIRRWPVGNLFVLLLLLVCYRLELAQLPDHIGNIAPFVLTRNTPLGLIGYIFIHLDIVHLAGNMFFLWVFGNAVCVRVGNRAYFLIFLALGVVAGLAHLSMSAVPAVGASGAINGIVGMFLVWFPMNYLRVFYLWPFGIGVFRARSYWMIPCWLVFDNLGVVLGWGGVAYWAHLSGFAAGFGLAVFLLKLGQVRMEPHEQSLLHVLGPRKNPDDELGPVAPRVLAARVERWATPMAPPGEYFVSFPCACGAELRAPRKRAGEEFTCFRCAKGTRIPGLEIRRLGDWEKRRVQSPNLPIS